MANRNKLGITLDLTSPRGVELVKRLVAVSDVVVENYAATVLPKLGLGWDALHAVNDGAGHALDAAVRRQRSVARLPRLRIDRRAGARGCRTCRARKTRRR